MEKSLPVSRDYPVMSTPSRPLAAVALCIALLTPIFYFGSQIAAAPFYPGYSFMSQAASLLGSPIQHGHGSSIPAQFLQGCQHCSPRLAC